MLVLGLLSYVLFQMCRLVKAAVDIQMFYVCTCDCPCFVAFVNAAG